MDAALALAISVAGRYGEKWLEANLCGYAHVSIWISILIGRVLMVKMEILFRLVLLFLPFLPILLLFLVVLFCELR